MSRSPAAWIITPAWCSRRFSTGCRSSAASARADAYDNLAELYTSQELPGVGASLGLDRLLAGMEELEMIPKVSTPAEIFIAFFDPTQLGFYLSLAVLLARRL